MDRTEGEEIRRAMEDAGVERPPGELDHALALVRFLRSRDPWDARQTPRSLIPHLLEEAHEVVDAIGADDPAALEGELGDLLLNVAFQVVIGEEEGRFEPASVVRRLEEKIVRRHPHLFGLGEEPGWEEAKALEREAEDDGLLDSVARERDPLLRAHRLQVRAAEVGFDWPDFQGALAKVVEEVEEARTLLEGARDRGVPPAEGRPSPGTGGRRADPDDHASAREAHLEAVEEELGDLLFAAVNLARISGVRADAALEGANRKFVRRFGALERMARERGVDLEAASLDEMDAIWEEVKGAGK